MCRLAHSGADPTRDVGPTGADAEVIKPHRACSCIRSRHKAARIKPSCRRCVGYKRLREDSPDPRFQRAYYPGMTNQPSTRVGRVEGMEVCIAPGQTYSLYFRPPTSASASLCGLALATAPLFTLFAHVLAVLCLRNPLR